MPLLLFIYSFIFFLFLVFFLQSFKLFLLFFWLFSCFLFSFCYLLSYFLRVSQHALRVTNTTCSPSFPACTHGNYRQSDSHSALDVFVCTSMHIITRAASYQSLPSRRRSGRVTRRRKIVSRVEIVKRRDAQTDMREITTD